MAQYLVTGGAGFIGSHLCDKLVQNGHKVRVLDDLSTGKTDNIPEAAELVIGDVRDAAKVEQAMQGVDGCFHLAAVASVVASNERWVETHQTNLTATINVFNAAKNQNHCPVVYASSAAVYGANTNVPLSETDTVAPLTAYGADKYGCELHAVPAIKVHGVPSTGMRFFNVYGPRQDPASPYSGVISIFARALASNKDILIHGDGSQSRDFIYVDDVCRALVAAMSQTVNDARVFNVCTGVETTILTLAKLLADITGYTKDFQHGESRVGDVHRSLGDNRAMRKVLAIMPQTSLRAGLQETVAWMQASAGE